MDSAKKAAAKALLDADLYIWIRKRFSLSKVHEKFRERDISDKIKESILKSESFSQIVTSIASKLSVIVRQRAEDLRYVLESR